MKIGIILHPYGEKKPAGLARFIFDLTKSLVENDEKNEYIIYLKKEVSILPKFSTDNYKVHVLGFGKLWRDLGFYFAPKADFYIFNTPILPILFKPKKTAVIILDFGCQIIKPKSLKDSVVLKIIFLMNKFSLSKADNIISISEYTKTSALELFKISKDKIKVIYPGYKKICAEVEKKDNQLSYFLFVGVIKQRKNVHNLVSAFIKSKKEGNIRQKLIIVGKGSDDYMKNIKKKILESGLEEEILFLGHVGDDELANLYKNAYGFLFPSYIEGFGFPILEAMSCGIPVLTSHASSLGEVAGGAALLVDPLDVDGMSNKITELATNNGLRKELVIKGYKRTEDFSWKKSAKEYYRLYKN